MPTTVHVVMDLPKLTWFRGWQGPLGQSFGRLEKETVWRQKRLAHVRTGALSSSITSNRSKQDGMGNLTFTAGSWTVHYAAVHELGSKPHKITAKGGGTLVFFWPKVGRVVAFKSVQHPGTRAYRFLTDGMAAAVRMWERGG